METQSFVLGMLMTYGVTLTTVVVIGLVKISRLVKQQKSLEDYISNIRLEMDSRERDVRRIMDETNREITLVERTIMQRIDKEIDLTNRHIHDEVVMIHRHEDEIEKTIHEIDKKHQMHEDEIIRTLEGRISDAISYTDSRIDKVVLSGTITGSKRPTV